MKFFKHLNEEWTSVNENSHNFKIEHNTALKLEKHKVEELINCLKQKNGK